MRLLAPAALAIASACASLPAPDDGNVIAARVDELLSRYARNDVDGVIALMDPTGFVIYGSDVSEVVRSPKALREMMQDDFKLWGVARFGRPADLDVRISGDLATAMFHAPFTVGENPAMTVRFATTWRHLPDGWHLTQSANTVPTRGSSARELLRR